LFASFARWFDAEAVEDELGKGDPDRVDWLRIVPFLTLHVACLGVIWVGWSWTAIGVAIGLYVVRMFAITGAYHRYFCHKAYKTSRFWQFIFAVIGNASAQRGPLWWAGNHRHHHRHADTAEDVHSPLHRGFLWSHVTWLTTRRHFRTRWDLVRDWAQFPELVWLNRYSLVVPLALLGVLIGTGEVLRLYVPEAGTSGLQLGIWGFCISTVVLFHATATINSLDHMIGRRRYRTRNNSRNNWALAILTFGEGWHNNHHHFPGSARQGFFWWEIDLTYYLLVVLSWLGIVRDLKPVPTGALKRNRIDAGVPTRQGTESA
jgi:stearoyl-CoA desaturase (delta-9 desaturase)